MNFSQSVSTVLSKYAVFTGRASRPEFWWFVVFNIIVGVVAGTVDYSLGIDLVSVVVSLGLLLPGLGVTIRRLHDVDRSGWWIFLGLVPIVGVIVLIIFYATAGTPGPNRFGPAPLA